MAALRWALIAAFISAPVQSGATPLDRWASEIREASRQFGIPQQWIRAVMKAESGGRVALHGTPITSRAGAMGLMQLMPATWSDMRRSYGLGSDPYNARDNVLAGTAYLRAMYDRFGYPGLFAAYNEGPTRYSGQLEAHRGILPETRAYVANILSSEGRGNDSAKANLQRRRSLFALRLDKARLEPAGAWVLFAVRR